MTTINRLRRNALILCLACNVSFAWAQGGSPAYTVGATATGIPFTFLDIKTDSLQGMMVDTVNALSKAGGFQVNVQQTSFSALIPSLTANKIDIISAAMIKTPAREKVVAFSTPVYSYGESLMVRSDDNKTYTSLDDLKGEVVGAQVGTIYLDMLNRNGSLKEVRSYDSVADMARDLQLGRIKAALGDQPLFAYQVRSKVFQGVKVATAYKPVNTGDVCLVVRKGDTATLARLNQAIAAIKADGTLAKIVQKWGM